MPDETITLESIARQLDRALDRIGAIEDQITVLTGVIDRMGHRLTRLEDWRTIDDIRK
jgi:hypothetical protein